MELSSGLLNAWFNRTATGHPKLPALSVSIDHCPAFRDVGENLLEFNPTTRGLEWQVNASAGGDTLVVHSMDRLARNLDDLRRFVKTLTERRVCIEFVKEGLMFTGDDSSMANLMQWVMGAFAEFERSLLRERQREGIALAKQRGAYRGRKRSLGAEQIAELIRRIAGGEQKSPVARDMGIWRETLYTYLRRASPAT